MSSAPVRCRAVVVVDAFFIGAIAPSRRLGSRKCGSTLKLLASKADHVPALAGIVFERVPRQWVIALADARQRT
jgi:hypothetical protein